MDKPAEHLGSSSCFDEKEDNAQDNLNGLKSELFTIGLSEVQVSSVLIKYPINFIGEAVFNTINANSLKVIDKLPAQYFYGILKNIESQQGLELWTIIKKKHSDPSGNNRISRTSNLW